MADLSLVLIMAVWGSSFALQRTLLAVASPLLLLGIRMALATALLAGFLASRPRSRPELLRLLQPEGRELVRDGLACGALLAAGFLLQTKGLQYTTASRSGFLTGLLVVFTPLLQMAIFRKRPSAPAVAGIALAFAGLALLSGFWRDSALGTFKGDALTVGCAVIFSGHILLLGKVTARHPVWPLVLLQLACVGAAALLVGPLVEPARFALTAQLWGGVVYLALFCTLLAFGVQTWAQRHTTPVRMALISSLEPVFAALWALLIGERLHQTELAGGALIVLGVVVGEVGPMLFARARTG